MKSRIYLFIIIIIFLLIVLSTYLVKKLKPPQENLSIDRKISQMLVLGYTDDKSFNSILDNVSKDKISGVIFYARNIKDSADILSTISIINSKSVNYPLFMMLDQEGGQVSRISPKNGFNYYPSAEFMAQKNDINKAYDIYFDMAKTLKTLGFNFNLAPCVDIKTNETSSIGHNKRSYGSDDKTVTNYSRVFIKAHNKNRVITALKHYPGLGATHIDTHKSLPDISESWSKIELNPFLNILSEFPNEPVMVGHVLNKNLDEKYISSFSKNTLDILSVQMGHKGIVIMDASDMSAIKDYSISQIIVSAINAGVDLFIFPNHTFSITNSRIYMDAEKFHTIILNAIANGEINEVQIEKSYNKIINLKENFLMEKKDAKKVF